MLIGKPVRQVVVPTTLELFDYWLLHDFVKRYASMQIVSKNMIGAPPGVRPAQVLPNVDGVMTSSGTRVFAYRGHEYHARYRVQRPIDDDLTSISDEFGTGAEILVVQRRPDRLQVFFRDIEAGWLEERFITWLRFAYPEAEFVQPATEIESSDDRMMSKKGKSGRPRLACNEWARATFNKMMEEAKGEGEENIFARFCNEHLHEYEERYKAATGNEHAEPERSLRSAVLRTTKQ